MYHHALGYQFSSDSIEQVVTKEMYLNARCLNFVFMVRKWNTLIVMLHGHLECARYQEVANHRLLTKIILNIPSVICDEWLLLVILFKKIFITTLKLCVDMKHCISFKMETYFNENNKIKMVTAMMKHWPFGGIHWASSPQLYWQTNSFMISTSETFD